MNFWPHTNKFNVLLKYYINKNIRAKPAAILTLGTWWPCNSILPFGKYFLSTYILMLVKPLPLTETTEMPNWEKLEYFSNIWTANNLYRNQKIFRTKKYIYICLTWHKFLVAKNLIQYLLIIKFSIFSFRISQNIRKWKLYQVTRWA